MLESNWLVPPTHFSDPIIADRTSAEDKSFQSPSLHIRQSFVNNLNVPITLVHRSGFRVQLDPEPNMARQCLIARTEIRVTGKSYDSVKGFLSVIDEHASPELRAMREAFQIQVEYGLSRHSATIMLDYPIDITVLRSHGSTVYYSELDMVVSLLPIYEVCEHPYSQAGRDVELANSLPIPISGLDFNYAVMIVDNKGKVGPRYLNMNNNVYKITPKQDRTRKDGVYVTSTHEVHSDTDAVVIGTKRYGFDNMEETTGLYASSEEARVHGDMKLAQQIKFAELERTVIEEKHTREKSMLRHKAELEELVRKSEKEKLAAETERRNADASLAKLKDELEIRSQLRKDSGESLKFLPNLIIGLGAVILAFNKLTS